MKITCMKDRRTLEWKREGPNFLTSTKETLTRRMGSMVLCGTVEGVRVLRTGDTGHADSEDAVVLHVMCLWVSSKWSTSGLIWYTLDETAHMHCIVHVGGH